MVAQESNSSLQLTINNEVVLIKPNTLVYTTGNPEVNLITQSIGHGAVSAVRSPDFETAKSKITFELVSTSDNEVFVRAWISNKSENLIQVISENGATGTFSMATVTNQPEINAGTDGSISVEFESLPGSFTN